MSLGKLALAEVLRRVPADDMADLVGEDTGELGLVLQCVSPVTGLTSREL